ncbi:unnamed protein product [Rangifer tarandus platyrhynchus]|uniref:Basic proline-rich protein-like n=1 Tax=Rangifer tarandus platyrhynchus TaxID=3082113 RepID=A0ABN9A566_RANTA|nr:unnamed protein product [Rangifer tarandus platyrhynchus]
MRPHGPRALLRNKENPELERIPGLCCRPQAALRPRCCPSVPQGPARPPPREELSARSLHISNTPPARHARSHPTTAAVPAPLSSDPPPDLALGPTPAGPPALPSPEGASERRPGAERRRDCGPGRPPSFSGQGPRTAPPRPKSPSLGSPARPPPDQGGAYPAFGRPRLQFAAPASGSGCGSRAPWPSAGRRVPRGRPAAERPAGQGILAAAARGRRVPLNSTPPPLPPSPRAAATATAAALGSRRSAGCAPAAGGGGRSRAHASAGASAPPLGPPRPRLSEARPAESVCRSASLWVLSLASAGARPPHARLPAEAP